MKFHKTFAILMIIFCCSTILFGQKSATPQPNVVNSIKGSPAYAEILLRKVELESEVESLLITYKEDFPKVKDVKFELSLVQKDLDKLLSQTDAAKLTLALGKLMVKKNQLETELWSLQNKYGAEYPEVKRTKRKVLTYQNAIKEILP